MNELEPRVAGCERAIKMLDRLFRNLRPQVAQAYQGMRDNQDPYGQGPDGAAGYIARARTTTAVATGTVDAPGNGTATLTLSGRTTAVYSIYDKTIATGAGVMLGREQGKWYILSVDSCNSIGNPAAGSEPDFFGHQLDTLTASEGIHPASGRVRGFEEITGPFQDPATLPTLIQHAVATGNSGAPACTFTNPVGSGNAIIVKLAWNSGGGALTLAGFAADSVLTSSDPYVSTLSRLTGGSGTTTVTGSLASSARWIMAVEEWAGLAAGGLDKTANAFTFSSFTALSGTTAATTQASEMAAIAIAADDGTGGDGEFSSPTNGYTILENKANGAGLALVTLYKVLSSTGAQSTAATCTARADYNAVVATYKH